MCPINIQLLGKNIAISSPLNKNVLTKRDILGTINYQYIIREYSLGGSFTSYSKMVDKGLSSAKYKNSKSLISY